MEIFLVLHDLCGMLYVVILKESKMAYDHAESRPAKNVARNLACEYRGRRHKVALIIKISLAPSSFAEYTLGG